MVYADTSALVPAFVHEPKSGAVLKWLESSGERLVVSEWAIAEFASAMAIKVRTGQTARSVARQAMTRFLEFAQKHCSIAAPQRAEFRRAAELAGDTRLTLRAGDALHLAIAEASNVQTVLCLDDGMSEGARAIGLGVVPI